MARSFWLSDEAWATIASHLPRGLPGKPRVDDRRVISGILRVIKVGCRWRDCPPEQGPATTIDNRDHRWAQRGRWQRRFAQVAAAGGVPEELALDRTYVKAHRSASGGPEGPRQRTGGAWTQAIGASRGGQASKVQGLADDRGRPSPSR